MKAVLIFLFPILEFYLLVRAGMAFGALNVVLWCIATAFLGAWVLKDHGLSVLRRAQAELVQGLRPHDSMSSAVLVFFAGILLILPGFITDVLGLAFLIPPVRRAVGARLAARTAAQGGASQVFFFRGFGPGFPSSDDRSYGQGAQYDAGEFQSREPRQVTVIDCTPGEIREEGQKSGRGSEGGPDEGRGRPEDQVFDCEATPLSGDAEDLEGRAHSGAGKEPHASSRGGRPGDR